MTSNPSDDFDNGEDGSVKNGDSFEGVERNGDLGLVIGEDEDPKDPNREGDGDRQKEGDGDRQKEGDVSVEDESVKKDDSFVEGAETNQNEERNGDLGMGNEMGILVPEEKEVFQSSELEEDHNQDGNEKFVSGDSLFESGDCVVETNASLGFVTHEAEPSYLDEEGQKVEVKNFLLQENDKTGFSVNDLVWGKVKSHPWWPGQIFDPKHASEMALKRQKKDCFLVAYFGDNTFAWVPESQLKPFQACFSAMEKQSCMVPFVNAVNAILEEVTRQVELGMACPCLGDEAYDDLKYQKLENAGIQNGTCRAVVDRSVFVNAFRPERILEYVRVLAQCPFGEFDRLELTIATAQLKDFYRSKGWPELLVFVYGGGLVENDAEISLANTKMSGKGEADSSTIAASSIRSEKRPRGRRSKNHLSEDDDRLNSLSKKKEEVASSIKSGKRPRGRPRKDSVNEDGSEQKNQFEQMEEDVDRSGYKVKSVARASSKNRRVADSDSADLARSKKERHEKEVDSYIEPPSSTPARSLRVGDRISRAASQLQNSEMLSQLCLFARDPMQGCDFLPMIIDFFTKFKDSHSSGFSEVQELVKSMERKGGRKRKVNFEDASSEMSEPDSMQDSYWSDIILQNSPEKELVSKGQKRKRGSQKKGQNKKTKPNDKQEVEGRRIVSGLEEIKNETPTALILSFQ